MHMQLASVQFHLINTVILFLSREGFRRGCLRTPVVTRFHLRMCICIVTSARRCMCCNPALLSSKTADVGNHLEW